MYDSIPFGNPYCARQPPQINKTSKHFISVNLASKPAFNHYQVTLMNSMRPELVVMTSPTSNKTTQAAVLRKQNIKSLQFHSSIYQANKSSTNVNYWFVFHMSFTQII